MHKYKFLGAKPFRGLICIRYVHCKPESIVIASATRTPWGKYKGLQLGQWAVEAAVKQSAIPLEQIREIYMTECAIDQRKNEFIFSDFLKKARYNSIKVGNTNQTRGGGFVKALDTLKSHSNGALVVGGLQSLTEMSNLNDYKDLFPEASTEIIENYISQSLLRYVKSQTEGIFDSEIVPLAIQQTFGSRRVMKDITQDEIQAECHKPKQYCDGAAALVLTTFSNAQALNISPLGVIIDYEYVHNPSHILSSSRLCVENLLKKCDLDAKAIQSWEIEDMLPQLVIYLKNHFDLDIENINPHGGYIIMGHSSAASLLRSLTHLVHSLYSSEYGCVLSASSQESLALIIQKLGPSPATTAKDLPLLTLFTKDPCHLCDMLVEDLDSNFCGEYELEKVFIDTKENLRFLRLYRHDIPVVFLNNQFLCMHRLNHRLLRRKLDLFKNNKLDIKQ